MISKAYIHEYGNGKIEPEHRDIKETLESRGIECELFTTKRLLRNQIAINGDTLVVGDHPTMLAALKKLEIAPTGDSYPISLRNYLKRNVWESNVKKILSESYNSEITNIFIKPKSKAKLFTGFVIHSNQDLYRLEGIAKDIEIYCSSVVEWLSEYRVFVNKSEIVGIKNYDGDANIDLNMEIVEKAVREFENSSQRTDGYGIDFGILENGETALVEWNDGFALGSYGLEKDIYTNLILARWDEMVNSGKP